MPKSCGEALPVRPQGTQNWHHRGMSESELPTPPPRNPDPPRDLLGPTPQPKQKKHKKKVSREPPRGRGRGGR